MALSLVDSKNIRMSEERTSSSTITLAQLPTAAKTNKFHNLAREHLSESSSIKNEFTKVDLHYVMKDLQKELKDLQESLITSTELTHEKAVTQMDIISLYVMILKLMIEGKKQERISRHDERKLQLDALGEVVKNYKKTGNWLQSAGIMSGVMGIAAGITPMLGFTSLGGHITNGVGNAFQTFQGLKPEDFFNKMSKIISSMGQMQQTMGEVRKVNAEGERAHWQSSENDKRTNHEENTRDIEEIKQMFGGLVRQIEEILERLFSLTRELYG